MLHQIWSFFLIMLEQISQGMALLTVMLLILPRRVKRKKIFPSLSVLVPAHNEGSYIEECVTAILNSKYEGKLEVIAINDGSIDETRAVLSRLAPKHSNLSVLHNEPQKGKAFSLNRALTKATGELVAVVDGDSIVEKNAFHEIVQDFADDRIHCSCGTIYAKNLRTLVHIFIHMQIIYQSLFRYLMAKIDANLSAPGPLTVYRRKTLIEVGKFSTDGYCEDTELAVRIQDNGYRVVSNRKAKVGTYLPHKFRELIRQQIRWYAGTIYVVKRKFTLKRFNVIQWFAMPMLLLGILNGYIFGPLTIIALSKAILTGITTGAEQLGNISLYLFNEYTIHKYFHDLHTVYKYRDVWGPDHITMLIQRFLGPTLYIYATFFFAKSFRIQNIIGIYLLNIFFPFLFFIQLIASKGFFQKSQYNQWTKAVVEKD